MMPASERRVSRERKALWLAVRLAFAAGGIAFVVWSMNWTDRVVVPAGFTLQGEPPRQEDATWTVIAGDPRGDGALTIAREGRTVELPRESLRVERGPRLVPGIVTTLRGADWQLLALGLLLVGPTILLMALRWWALLRARGFQVGFAACFRLTMIGYFSNFALPGTVSGDVVRAYYAARDSARKADAATSVLVDRLVGLFSLLLLACVASVFIAGDPFGLQLALGVWAVGFVAAVVTAMYLSRRIRARIAGRIRMPALVEKLDVALVAYRDHAATIGGAVVLSLATHTLVCVATIVGGVALGMRADWALALVVVPVLYLVGAVPVSYQGFGLMEAAAFALLLDPPDVTANQLVGMLLLSRVYRAAYALIGAGMLARGRLSLDVPTATAEAASSVLLSTAHGTVSRPANDPDRPRNDE